MHSAPIISRNVNYTVSILYILFYIDIQNDSYSFFLIVMDVLQIDLGLGLPGIFQVPGVGFNDVVIETPFHNMCAALEQEECLGSLHFFLVGRLHAPCFFLEMPWVVHHVFSQVHWFNFTCHRNTWPRALGESTRRICHSPSAMVSEPIIGLPWEL